MSTFDDEMQVMEQDVAGVLGTAMKLYRPNLDPAFNFSAGARATSYNEQAITLNAHEVRMERNAAGAKEEVMVFDAVASQVTGGPPTTKWYVGTSDSTRATAFPIASVETVSNGKGYRLTARKNA